jgi:hypothetical protein
MMVRRRLGSLVPTMCLGLAVVACSSADDTAACAGIIRSITEGSQAIAASAEDPATAGDQLRGFADDLRAAAEGANEEISSAAEDVATLYDDMADDIETSGVPDMSQLTSTIGRLQEACT